MKPTIKRDPPRPRRHAVVGNDPVLVELGGIVRSARLAAGLTQEELALASRVGRELVMALELGRPGVALGHASRVLKSLGLHLTARPK